MRSTIGWRCANKLEVVTDLEHLMHIDPNILLSRSEYEQNHVSKIRTTMENFASFAKSAQAHVYQFKCQVAPRNVDK